MHNTPFNFIFKNNKVRVHEAGFTQKVELFRSHLNIILKTNDAGSPSEL